MNTTTECFVTKSMTKEKLPTTASSGATYESEKRLVSSYLRAARYEDSELAFRKVENARRRRCCAFGCGLSQIRSFIFFEESFSAQEVRFSG
jgi:hypothetical protein